MSLHKSRTVAVLKKMSKEELGELQDYVDSRFSKASPNLKAAFKFLMNCSPDFKKGECSKEQFSFEVFGRKLSSKEDKEINRLVSEMRGLIENYILIKMTFSDQSMKQLGLIVWYKAKNLDYHTNRQFKEAEQAVLKERIADCLTMYKDYLKAKIDYFILKRDLQQSYLVQKHYLHVLAQQQSIEMASAQSSMVNTSNILRKEGIKQINVRRIKGRFMAIDLKNELRLFELQLKFLTKPDAESYFRLKKALSNERLLITENDRLRFAIPLHSNITKIFSGPEYNREHLSLSKLVARFQVRTYDGFVAPLTYRNVIVGLCDFRKIREAYEFQKDIQNNILGVSDINNHITIYHAHILYAEKKYGEALHVISACSSETVYAGIDIRILKIKLAYSMQDKGMMDAHVNNLRKYISTSPKFIISSYALAFAKFSLKLFKIPSSEKEALAGLKKQVKNDSSLYNRRWLLEEIDAKLAL